MSTQPAWNRPRPHLEKEPQIRTALRQAHLPQNRSCRQRVNTKTPTPAEDAPSGSRTAPLGSVLGPYGASSRPGRTGPPPAHPCVRQGHRPACVRPAAYAPGEVPATTHQAAPPELFSGVPEPAAPRPGQSQSFWRNVGLILGSIRRLTVGLPTSLWVIPMGLLDPSSNMWGVRHHDSPPVSEWCS